MGDKVTQETCYVCREVRIALLGRPAIQALEIVVLKVDKCNPVISHVGAVSSNEFVEEFPQVFTGLGKIKGDPIHITIKDGVNPYHLSAPRRIAFPLLQPLKEELKRMEDLGVILPVEKPTEWCHPIVVLPKPNGKIRLCLDLTKLNEVTKREFHQLEGVNETLAKLGTECVVMTKVDANSGYWQMPLDEESILD